MRWGFRARLTALIALVFVLGGGVLLMVQYLLVQQLFSSQLETIVGSCEVDDSGATSCGGTGTTTTTSGPDGIVDIVWAQSMQLSHDVLSGLVVWSLVVLAVFAVVAVIAARWLAGRSLGRIARITGTTREITRDDLHRRLDLAGPDDEIKELGDTIDGMLDRLDDAFTRQERFVAGASHELRTPLTTTRAALEIPLAQGRVPADLEPDVRRALAATARSEQLIAALLGVARASQDPQTAPVELAGLARAAIARVDEEALGRGIRVDGHALMSAVAAADETLAAVAIGNLVDNAVRHGRPGGAVSVASGVDGQGAWVEVSGDGPVLTAAETARLPEPFHRGDRSRLAGGGSGLGLTLVETIVRHHRGALALTPRSGGGLVARVTLPRA
ncbi:sensor histidine kinase [Microbacterium sp.]|uniref:sensor histidine kinase n=1 Tax=Microbacterium sp. TaxID=51671 RepID=UPI0039E2D9F5